MYTLVNSSFLVCDYSLCVTLLSVVVNLYRLTQALVLFWCIGTDMATNVGNKFNWQLVTPFIWQYQFEQFKFVMG